jgi:hypothetical protein
VFASSIASREIKILLAIMALGVIVRVYDIRQPLIDSWRGQEAETAMVAENFYLHGFNILRPQVNWRSPANGSIPLMAGDDQSAGYAGTEFPLVPFLAAASYLLVGVAEWPGRLLSVVFFALSLPFFYLVERRILKTQAAAMTATAVFSLMPLSVFMGREFMPDMASLCLSIIGLYFFIDAVENESHFGSVWLAGLATSLAILVRLSAVTIGLVFFYICWTRFGPAMYSTARLWGMLALAFVPPLAWYWYAYQLSVSYPPYYLFWQDGIHIASRDAYLRILYSTATTGVTPFVAAAMVAGFFLPGASSGGILSGIRTFFPRIMVVFHDLRWGRFQQSRPSTHDKTYGGLFHWWLFALILYVVVAGENNAHPWSAAAIVPIGAAMAGRVCDFLFNLAGRRRKSPTQAGMPVPLVAGIVIFLCGTAISAYGYLRPLYQEYAEPLRTGAAVDKLVSSNALVLLAGDGDPAAVYYSRRKCLYFPAPAGESEAISRLEEFRDSGVTHIVFTSSTRGWLERYKGFTEHLDTKYRRVRQSGDDVILFELTQPMAKPSGKPVLPYQLMRSAMRRFPDWAYAILRKPPTDEELIDLAAELHAKYPQTHFHVCDDPGGLSQLDRASDNLNLFFPENWYVRHYFGMINVIRDGGRRKWRLMDPKRNKILADLE